ncbi:DUF2336 domain-containing protein [Stappia sp. ES.058]|uniref:DUF2336 domain-containing protein n=1 Tax=Stappia sp. ES.058 TaxID=1881061 RepID=UPI00087A5C62|nr:DUF2336 domain-containing protein [Stappia sp. ES.058]SDU27583.1 Uncharacterized conserved protein, DUF2336 family [Stappia sp. ES.058]
MNATQLAELARNGSAESTGELVSALTDLFCRAPNEERERVSLIFGDIVLRVLDRLECAARAALSQRIADDNDAPKDLLKALAADEELEVATPVLEQGGGLSDQDFAEVAEAVPTSHLMVLTQRPAIKPVLTKVIAQRGEPQVLHALTCNHSAVIGVDSFDLLVGRARKDMKLQQALSERADIPESAAERLVPFLSRELAQRIKDLNVNEVLVKAIAERAAHEVEIQLREFNGAKSKTEQLIDAAVAGSVPIDTAIVAFADKDRAFELGQLLARTVGWPDNVVVPLVFREDDLPILFLCRLGGVSDTAYMKIVRMRAKRMRLSSSASSEAMRKYAELSEDAARSAFKVMAQKMKLPVND